MPASDTTDVRFRPQSRNQHIRRRTWPRWTSACRISTIPRPAHVRPSRGSEAGEEAHLRKGVSRPTVVRWRDRCAEHGLAGLDDEQRAGHGQRRSSSPRPRAGGQDQ
ncbi:MAG: helix-turn-helix domain-containing protein [Pedococcus sp.]